MVSFSLFEFVSVDAFEVCGITEVEILLYVGAMLVAESL